MFFYASFFIINIINFFFFGVQDVSIYLNRKQIHLLLIKYFR